MWFAKNMMVNEFDNGDSTLLAAADFHGIIKCHLRGLRLIIQKKKSDQTSGFTLYPVPLTRDCAEPPSHLTDILSF